jgi:diadenosine tetraphosphate (Ap4A) HIT family hydrolase
MIRNRGPISTLGYNLTSRDLPVEEGETEGPSPNSGHIAKALNGHPVMRFFASATTALVVTHVASKFVSAGGIKLATKIQKASTSNGQYAGVATRFIESAGKIKKALDELEGVHRSVDGVDPSDVYSKLVFESGGERLKQNLDRVTGGRFLLEAGSYLTTSEIRAAGKGITHEPPAVWTIKDDIQQLLTRRARNLAVELPALYVAQRAVTEPLYGDGNRKDRGKWYNPVDVISDFAKQSTINIASMLTPLELGGAALSRAKFLASAPYSKNPNLVLTAKQTKLSESFLDIKTILGSFGQDMQKVLTGLTKNTTALGVAFSSAADTVQNSPGSSVFALQQARRGGQKAAQAASDRGAGKLQTAAASVKGYLFGHQVKNPLDIDSGQRFQGAIDAIPALRGTTSAFSNFRTNFRTGKIAYDVLGGALAYDEALRKVSGSVSGGPAGTGQELLKTAISNIRDLHTSKFSDFSTSLLQGMFGAGSVNKGLTSGDFGKNMQEHEYKKYLRHQLVNSGVSKDTASRFVQSVGVGEIPGSLGGATNVTRRLRLGTQEIVDDNNVDDFFQQLIDRTSHTAGYADPSFTKDALANSIELTDILFAQKQFRETLEAKISNSWAKVYDSHVETGRSLVRPQKVSYSDFAGDVTPDKADYLARSVADTMGIKLIDKDGRRLSKNVIGDSLAKRGINVEDTGQLRAYLIENRRMTSPVHGDGFNVFGLKPLLIDEAFQKGLFSRLEDDQKNVIEELATQIARTDPLSSTIGYSQMKGVYQTRSGEVLDTTRITGMLSRGVDFLRDNTQIPVLKFNPLDMIGQGGAQGIDKRRMFEYTEGFSAQPFGNLGEETPNLYIFSQEKRGFFGAKGSISLLSNDSNGSPVIKKMPGLYRQFSTNENDMFSRAARSVAQRQLTLALDARGPQDDSSLGLLDRVKKKFDVAEEQQNSLARYIGRFRKRRTDINNPTVFARLMADEEVSVGRNRTLSLRQTVEGTDTEAPKFGVVDQEGNVIYDHKSVLNAYESFRRRTQSYGTPVSVIKEFEKRNSGFLTNTLDGSVVSLSGVTSDSQLRDFALEELKRAEQAAVNARSYGVDSRAIAASSSLVRKQMSQFNLNEVSGKSSVSPTISTRFDELRESIFQLALQRRSFESLSSGGSINPGQLAVDIEEIVSDLRRRNVISQSQATEARAAGLSAVLNFVAFSGYKKTATQGSNLSEALSGLLAIRNQPATSESYKSLLHPFTSASVSNVGTLGFGTGITNLFRPAIVANLKPADYSLNELHSNPLGNQGTVYVPTFATAVGSVGFKRATKNILGINTYDDAGSFSSASVAVSHGVERLNKYFETFGLGLDTSQYSGPLDLYARGMVGKRVLPLVAGGTAIVAADRTIGGAVNEKDEEGNRVYSPFLLGKVAKGAVETQSVLSGITPGGMSYNEKKEQLTEGEVPIKQGRFWPLGVTPFAGGKTMYHRPSYYRRLMAGSSYTEESFGSPMERLAFGYDFSPLRPFDPYRFEKQHYEDRPYPVTGEYFSGPFGPITPLLNATVGKILKPQIRMHRQEVEQGLANYSAAGESGAYNAEGLSGYGGDQYASGYVGATGSAYGGAYGLGSSPLSGSNQRLASAGSYSMQTGSNMASTAISNINSRYVQASQYGPMPRPGVVPPNIIPAGRPVPSAKLGIQAGDIGYRTQEMAGIYGFGFGSLREAYGFGQSDLQPQVSVLQSASKAYGSGRAFWDLNLGGLGDIPIKPEGALGNVEISEIVRRFIPKERTDVTQINPIPNTMGVQYPFLPGSNYFNNFKQGDPYTKVPEGEIRLPGIGYRRLNPNMGDYNDPLTQLDILSDVAPYSKEFRSLNNKMSPSSLDPGQRKKLEEIRAQVEDTTKKYNFSPYKYKYSSPEEQGMSKSFFGAARIGEYIAHRDTFINTKIMPKRTAQEDWERRNVYGSTFPQWQNPIESFIKPMYYKSQSRSPLTSGLMMAGIGAAFGRGPTAKAAGTLIGFATGAGYSMFNKARQQITGETFIPKERKKQLALEENIDILNYVKNTSLANRAEQMGDTQGAAQFKQAAKRTMYGADIYGSSVDTLSLAIPKRKREHFKEMLNAPVQERERILSTAPRLERRIYEAAWGMKVEKRPDLVEHFSRHELPDASWEGWNPSTNMEHVKINMGQSMGINMAQMGYYPQQIKEASLANPSYPNFNQQSNSQDVGQQIRMMMSRNGMSGSVVPVMNGSGSSGVDIYSGVR